MFMPQVDERTGTECASFTNPAAGERVAIMALHVTARPRWRRTPERSSIGMYLQFAGPAGRRKGDGLAVHR
jgi:hypothetical protein